MRLFIVVVGKDLSDKAIAYINRLPIVNVRLTKSMLMGGRMADGINVVRWQPEAEYDVYQLNATAMQLNATVVWTVEKIKHLALLEAADIVFAEDAWGEMLVCKDRHALLPRKLNRGQFDPSTNRARYIP